MPTFFRIEPGGEDPRRLLDPAEHLCEPWGGGETGPCDKCDGAGETDFACLSCLEGGAGDPTCAACAGLVRGTDRCPVCLGTGEIDGRPRHGVSVFPTEAGLLRYMRDRAVEVAGDQLVELDGEPTGDVDFDADEGALLVRPTAIVAVREL